MLDQAEKYARAHRRRTRWHKVTTVMASIVVFGTTYALILPAITQERTTCGLVEHIHDDSCYREIPAVTRQELVCSEDSLNIHQHTKECYDEEKNLICGYADFIVHKHDDTCYDESGNLVCTLPEIEAHTHDNSCYAQPASAAHVHTEDCYTLQPVFLVCTETEGEGHIHTADCYTETTYLSCMFSDVEGHEHGPECYETVTELTCGQSEGGGHVHGEDCYVWDEVLTCEYADVTPEEPELICNKEEIVLHKHTKDCYDEDGNLICGKLEVLEHKHTEDCFQTVVVSEATRELICEKPEHTHDSSCYPETEKITETQTEELTGAATEAQTEKLTEAETEAETGELAEAASEAQTEELTEAESEAQTEELTEAESESESEEETELLTETESEELTEVESESETEEESETETEEADVLDEEFRLTAQAESGIEVTVSGPVTSLPYPVEEISLTAEEVTDEEVLAIWKQTVEEAGLDDQKAFLLDIALWHNGDEIEPTGPVQVTFAGVAADDDNVAVYHIDTEEETAEDMNAVVDEEGLLSLDTDHFSIYAGAPLMASVSTFTVYFAVPNDWIDYSRIVFNAQRQTGIENWTNKNMSDTGQTYEGQKVYSVTFNKDPDCPYEGFATIQFQQWKDSWISQIVPFTSWEEYSTFNNKIYYNSTWLDYTPFDPDDHTTFGGKQMAFENKSDAKLTDVKAVFYEKEEGVKKVIKTVDVGNADVGDAIKFDIPTEACSYVQFIDGDNNVLGDTYSNFYEQGDGETGVESFLFNETSKYCYKYKSNAEDSTWGVIGNGIPIYNGTQLKQYLESAGDGVYYLANDIDYNTAITVAGNKTLNLNGKKITTNQEKFLKVNSGVNLTLLDTTEIEDTRSSASGDLYGNLASLTDGTLTYYVTESTAGATGTAEALYKHTVNFSSCGAIVSSSTGDNVINVAGGTLNVEGGRIAGNGSHALVVDSSSGGTINLSGGLIQGNASGSADGSGIYMGSGTLNMSGGYIAGGKSGNGGGIYMNSGTINMSGGVIAANIGTDNGKGGGIYVNSGTLNLDGGIISGNQVWNGDSNGGGGIFMESGTISMTGGYVTNNKKYGGANDARGTSGGGGIAYNTAKMYMSGGYITGNYSQEAGGGVYAGYWHKTDSGTRFVMSGGTIASNFARDGEGGGVRIAGGAQAVISAPSGSNVYITNNTTTTTKDWGGGGIFVQTDGTLNIMDVLITNNHAEGFGGGVASCPTGDVEAVVDKGAAIFENTADNRVVRPAGLEKTYDIAFKDQYERQQPLTDNDCQDYFCTNQSTINSQMLGGGSENWNGPGKSAGDTGNCPWYIDFDQARHPVMALTANPTEEAKTAAKNAASVFVSGNWSHTHGGGITTNGGLDMGKTDKQEVKTSLVMKATKQVQLANGSMQTSSLKGFSFVMLNKKPTWDTENKHWTYSDSDIVKVNSVSQKKTNTSAGEITFDKITYDIAGYYTYYMVEAPITGVTGSYEQDPTLYTVGVMVTSTTTTSGTTKTTTYTIEKIELKAEANGVVKGTKEITLPSGTDKTVTVTNLTGGKTFTNKEIVSYALPETGGAGTTLYTLGGLLLMAVAEFFLLYNYKKRRKEDVASS